MQKKERTKDFIKYGELKERVYGWQDALPLGNGVVGALCKMGARQEVVSFLLDGAVIGGEVGVLPDVSDKMKDVRTLIDGSNPVVAGATIENALKNKKYNPKLDSQIINGKFFIKFLNAKRITGFTKEIKFNQEEWLRIIWASLKLFEGVLLVIKIINFIMKFRLVLK